MVPAAPWPSRVLLTHWMSGFKGRPSVRHTGSLTPRANRTETPPPMRGKGRQIATVLADALRERPVAGAAAVAAAYAEACGWPLARDTALRALTREGTLIVVARTKGWADQVKALTPTLLRRVNERLGRTVACGIDVRVGPVEK